MPAVLGLSSASLYLNAGMFYPTTCVGRTWYRYSPHTLSRALPRYTLMLGAPLSKTHAGSRSPLNRTPPAMVLVWRLLVAVLLAASTAVEAFTPIASNPGARATPSAPTAASRSFAGGARTAARPVFPSTGVAGRKPWALSARRPQDDENDKIDVLTGSGLRGVDTSKLTGNDKRDADWFQRTAQREASGGLQWFEDPAVYLGLCLVVPVVILVWGVLSCYIPGYCPSTF